MSDGNTCRASQDPEKHEASTENPYSASQDPEKHEAWQEGYEDGEQDGYEELVPGRRLDWEDQYDRDAFMRAVELALR